jgi:putative hydrolase of the HAD superfamily
MKAVLFDLDDTLYPEMEFVRSGFQAVARYLDERFHLGQDLVMSQMMEVLRREGRGRVFDSVLRYHGLYSEDTTRLLVFLYRSHRPRIQPYVDTLPTLSHLRQLGIRLGLLTDGMASVQRNKIAALRLTDLFDAVLCSDELGPDCWKPSGTPYKVLLELLDASPSESAYVGNDLSKDFIWPNTASMISIQIQRQMSGPSHPIQVPSHSRARFVSDTLTDILPIVSGSLCHA